MASPQPTNNEPIRLKARSSNYDLFILAITLISLAALLIIFIPGTSEAATSTAHFIDTLVSFVFLFDFMATLFSVPDKRAYLLKWGWLDFLGSLPTLPLLRIFRLVRVVRTYRLLRRVRVVDLLHTFIERPAQSALLVTLLASILLLWFSSYMILVLEADSPEANIENAFDAVWWTMVTVTTVGYGDKFPTSESGRILAIFLMFAGITLFSILTSYLSSSFVGAENDERERMMAEIQTELAEVKQMLQQVLDSQERET